MHARSLALRTSLMIHRLYGKVEDRGDCSRLETPSVPDYWYGNCLAMPAPPGPGDFARWMARFSAELPAYGEGSHRVFLVDSPEGETGDAAPFIEAGFELNVNDVLATDAPQAPVHLTDRYPIRPLVSDRDWAALVETTLAVNAGEPGYDRHYVEGKTRAVRSAIERGEGAWWAAWDGGKLIGHLGLFWGEGLVRFQDVETHPDYRGQGVCRSILHAACKAAQALPLAAGGADRDGRPGGASSPGGAGKAAAKALFVIVPADDGVRRIYEFLGFAYRERTVDLMRPPLR